jgi:hypothetical protein
LHYSAFASLHGSKNQRKKATITPCVVALQQEKEKKKEKKATTAVAVAFFVALQHGSKEKKKKKAMTLLPSPSSLRWSVAQQKQQKREVGGR